MGKVLDYTGERMVPEMADMRTFWEHIYRYRFAAKHVRNKRVLDIACGEGYGTAALLKAGAASIVGVDVSEETCRHAKSKYGVDARIGDARKIPLSSQSVDVLVSFETIEHIAEPELFLDECLRVLAPGGKAIISTPNVLAYREDTPNNPYHLKELDKATFLGFLDKRFTSIDMYTQRPKTTALFSTRALASDRSGWSRLRGFGRMCRYVRLVSCPEIVRAKHLECARHDPVSAIATQQMWNSEFANPFAVRRESPRSQEVPIYFVAIASL